MPPIVITSRHLLIIKVQGLLPSFPHPHLGASENLCVSMGRQNKASCLCFSTEFSCWTSDLVICIEKKNNSFSRRMRNGSLQLWGTHLSVLHWYLHYHDSGYLATRPFDFSQLYSYIFVFLLLWGKGGHKNINFLGQAKLKDFLLENLKQCFINCLRKHQWHVILHFRCACLSSPYKSASSQVRVWKKKTYLV